MLPPRLEPGRLLPGVRIDVKGMGYYMPSCCVKVWEGMEVQTNSPEIRQARRDIVELLLDNHNWDCQTCERDGSCELQNLAYAMGVRRRHFEGKRKQFPIETSSHSVVRDPEQVHPLRPLRAGLRRDSRRQQPQPARPGLPHRRGAGPPGRIWTIRSASNAGSASTSAPPPRSWRNAARRACGTPWPIPKMHVVIQTAPSIRAAIGEGFGLAPGTPATGRMVTALRRLGFDAVFDTNFGADLTIVEEAHEFLTRLEGGGPLPMITSCSPGWINFLEKFYPELIPHASTCKSPMSMLSTLVEDLLRREEGARPEEHLRRGGDALRGEEIRGPPARAPHAPTACPIPTRCLPPAS